MINIKDRLVEHTARYKHVPVAGTTDTFDLVPVQGTVTDDGTDVNRSLLMALQGFYGNNIVFNTDGSIVETNQAGDVKTTVFAPEGPITETFTSGGTSIIKRTTFNTDGSITEELL